MSNAENFAVQNDYTTDSIFEIPTLLLDKQASTEEKKAIGWGSIPRGSVNRGIWHFYVEDVKFNALWKNPDGIMRTKCQDCVEINFTLDSQMPMAVAAYRTYQKRLMSRYWQSLGINIFVDLNTPPCFDFLNMYGVPKGWSSYATSASDANIGLLETQAAQAFKHAGKYEIDLLVYGGGSKVANMCYDHGWLHVPDARNAARKEK